MVNFEEQEAEIIRNANNSLVDLFEAWLRKKGLSDSTVDKHCGNVSFYLDVFLQYEEPTHASQGAGEVGRFLGDWFIRKAMWSDETSVKSNATSLKRFYEFMLERDEITEEELKELKLLIKQDLSEWVATVQRYNDPSVDVEDVWPW